MAQLEADSIWLEIGRRKILQSVYIKCETGMVTGLLARNGEGKTCLLNAIEGSMSVGNRSVRIDGRPVSRRPRPELLLYLPQFHFIPGHLRLSRIFSDYRIDLNLFLQVFPEFRTFPDHRMSNLSGGQRRLVELYVVLLSKTQFVLLDEPFTHLMPLHIEKLKKLILQEKRNKGILLTDHLYEQVVGICDHLYVLRNGCTMMARDMQSLAEYGNKNF